MAQEKEKFKNIDLLKFVGILIILYFHINLCGLYNTVLDFSPIINQLKQSSVFGEIWVSFYFIISGFFFFRYTNFATDFWRFFKKKIFRLCPVIIFAVCVYWLLAQFTPMIYQKYINVFTLLLLNGVGFTGENMGNIHPVWFVSALFWTMCLYFYITKIFDRKYVNLFMGIIPFFCFSFIVNTTYFTPVNYFNFINIGILKAMSGLAIGYWINEVYNSKQISIPANKISYLAVSAIEIYLFIFIVHNTTFHSIRFMNFLPLIFAFIILFYLFLEKKGLLSQLSENNISSFLGKYTYSIFVTHIIVMDFLNEMLWKVHPNFIVNNLVLNTLAVILLSVIFGVITYHFVEKPITKYLFKKLETDMILKNSIDKENLC